MSSKIKVDTIENVAGSGNVSLGSGHNLVVPGNITGSGNLTVDTNTLHVDSSNNKVGVGTTSPHADLHIQNQTGTNTGSTELNLWVNDDRGRSKFNLKSTDDGTDVGTFKLTTESTVPSNTDLLIMNNQGIMNVPNQPAFLVFPSGDQNNISTGTTVVFDSEVFDQNGDFASNTFTAPVTGRYQMSYCLRIDNVESDAIYTRTRLVTSNRTIQPTIIDLRNLSGDPAYWHFQVSILTDMDANDTAYVEFNQSQGTTQADIKVTSFFSGYLAC